MVYDDFASGPVACAGDCVAFWAHASGTDVTAANDGVLVAGSAGAPAVAVREGDAAPGTDATVGAILTPVMVTEGGAAVFQATLAGTGVLPETNGAIYSVSVGGTPVLVAREGDTAPGLAGSVQFAGFGSLALSPQGSLAFVADLRGGGANLGNNRALYLRAGAGQPVLIVRTGSPFDPGSGNRTVEEIVLDSDPAQSGLGAMADTAGGALVVFKLHFKDAGPNNTVLRSSGLFTALVSAPACYANCDGSSVAPVLNVADFGCFLQKFAAGNSYANCDGSTSPPTLNVADFSCFLQKFATGCP